MGGSTVLIVLVEERKNVNSFKEMLLSVYKPSFQTIFFNIFSNLWRSSCMAFLQKHEIIIQQPQTHHQQHDQQQHLGILHPTTVVSGQQQVQIGTSQSAHQIFVHRPTPTVESLARSHTLPFPFQL